MKYLIFHANFVSEIYLESNGEAVEAWGTHERPVITNNLQKLYNRRIKMVI